MPCSRRIADVENAAQGIQEVELDDGWTEAVNPEANQNAEVIEMDA